MSATGGGTAMRVRAYVAGVAVLAAAASLAVGMALPAFPGHHRVALAILVVLVVLAETLQIRYLHHDEVDALVLMEGVLAPLVFVSPGAGALVVTAVGVAVGNLIRRNPPVKLVFNVCQWLAGVAAGSYVLHAADPGSRGDLAAPTLLAIVLVIALVNQVAISGVLWAAAGSLLGSRSDRHTRAVVTGHVVSIGASCAVGVCLTGAYLWTPWALSVGVLVIVGAHVAGRANAALRIDSLRLAALQAATHALSASVDAQSALPAFLGETRIGFDVSAAELVLLGERGPVVHACSEAGYSVNPRPHELAQLLAPSLAEPMHVTVTGEFNVAKALERSGHQRALVAPLRSSQSAVGMLVLYDRGGIEGFEAGELTVAAALARELVGFLERVELVRAIDEERSKLADILGHTSDGIFTIEADGTVSSWNAGLEAMTGRSPQEMVGTRHVGALRARDAAGRDVLLERWHAGADDVDGLPAEVQVVSASGQPLWLSCSYSVVPASENRDDVLVVVARNITQARELERLKDDFVAVVSHELRTPLVPIKGWAQTLLTRGDRLSEEQRRLAVHSILSQAQKLESLVLNILEASRIEAGRTDADGVADAAAIAMRIVEDTLAARPDRVIRIRPPAVPCQVKGSPVWLERAIANLVGNAVKYSPDDEPVDVVVACEDDRVVVSVTDRGPGIPAESQERIFERFERLEESRTQTGTGLGLYITRRLARAMGGDVTVSSVPGAGSTFVLRLPVAAVVVPDPRPAPRPTGLAVR